LRFSYAVLETQYKVTLDASTSNLLTINGHVDEQHITHTLSFDHVMWW